MSETKVGLETWAMVPPNMLIRETDGKFYLVKCFGMSMKGEIVLVADTVEELKQVLTVMQRMGCVKKGRTWDEHKI